MGAWNGRERARFASIHERIYHRECLSVCGEGRADLHRSAAEYARIDCCGFHGDAGQGEQLYSSTEDTRKERHDGRFPVRILEFFVKSNTIRTTNKPLNHYTITPLFPTLRSPLSILSRLDDIPTIHFANCSLLIEAIASVL